MILRLKLIALSLAITLLIVLVGNAGTDLVLGRAPFADGTLGSIDAPDVAVLHIVFTSLPFVLLALVGSRSRLLWSTATLLTACFWAYATFRIWSASLTGFEGGADIGLGLIMMASPFLIMIILGGVAALRR